MSYRRKIYSNHISSQKNPIQWQVTFCSDMENTSKFDESHNLTRPVNQSRTFYNGQETSEGTNEGFASFQTLSDQKTRSFKHSRRGRHPRGRVLRYSNRGQKYVKRNVRYGRENCSNFERTDDQSSHCHESSETANFIPSFPATDMPDEKVHKYNIEFLPNSVNTDQQKMQANEQLNNLQSLLYEDETIDLDQCTEHFETKLSILNKSKEEYFNMLKCVKPSEIIMDSRRHIEKESNKCTAQHLEKICQVKSIIAKNEFYASVFKLHLKNLLMQQEEFDTYITSLKQKLNSIYDDNSEIVIKKADEIKQYVQNECSLFNKTLPAYAYKTYVLNALQENQMVLISSDNSYFFNIVIPAIIKIAQPDYNIISCESNGVSIVWLKTFIEQDIKDSNSETNFMTEEVMLKFLCDNFPVDKCIVIFNLPLKRTVNSDLSLAVLRDFLHKNKDSRLILITSVYEDVEKYQKYFSNLRVSLLKVPQLVLPVKTVWKKEPLTSLKNYIEEVVCTAFSVHILNKSGDTLAFLPNIADAKTAIALFTKKMKELNYNDVQCVLLHENSSSDSFSSTKAHLKPLTRTIFFTTFAAETISIKSVRYVIDCGLERDYMFDNSKNLDVMTTSFISRAKARLRKSIAGIYSTGICYRIYSKENFCNDMKSFECPDILNLNPFNTFVTLFHYQPEKALSIQFIEPLDDALKNSTIKHLKNFNAIKNGKLTQLGKKMGQLLLPARYSKLILQGIQWDFAYEAVILAAYFCINSKVFKYYKNDETQQAVDAAKLELIQHDSDALSFLHIFKSWMDNKCSSSWCDKYHIDMNVLNEVKLKVDEMCTHVYECLNETILQVFSEHEDSFSNILEMLFQCFSDNLCVFTGHYRSGYKILSSHHTAFLHPSSILYSKENLPQFIIFNKMNCTSRNFLIDITAIPCDMVLAGLTDKTLEFDYSDAFERTLVSKVIEPVSEKVIKQILLGKKAKKLLEIENLIKKELKNELIVIEPSVEKGCVSVYALEPILNSAVEIVDNILKSNLDNLINAEQIHILDLKKGETIVPLEIKCVMGAKIISVKVSDLKESESVHRGINAVGEKSLQDNSSSLQCSVNLTWIRRPCNGICYVNFNPIDFMQARKLATKSFVILGSEVYVEVSEKSKNQLLISDVPPEVRAIDIENVLRQILPQLKCINVELKFSPPFETTASDIENIKIGIQENCEEYTNLTDFDIIVPKPKDTATLMTAYINVFDTEDLSSVAESLSNTIINDFKITAIPVYRTIIKCSSSIYHALELHLKAELNEFKSYLCKTYHTKNPFHFDEPIITEDTTSLKFLSNDIDIMKQLQRIINELMEGEVLDKNSVKDIHKLFCHGGHMWLRTLEKSQKVYILEEYNSKVIRVYGPPQNCFEVKECILRFLEDTENEAIETIILSSEGNNRMLLKSVIKEYGVNLEPFVELCELRSAILDIKSCRLILHGSREGISKAKEALDVLSRNLDLTEEYSLLTSGEMCPVCACCAFNLTFRLQHCGHLYCNECILGLVEQAQFPLQCCAENCFSDIILDDIVRILNDDPERMKKLLNSSLSDFLERNRSEIFHCPAPDCSMFFYKNEVHGILKCPLCHNDICSSCNVVYHHGFTCDMYQGSKKDPDYSFKIWKKDTTECKECPRCKTAIEKNAGCDHMTCISCKAHFCWVCVREFSSAIEVYNHIPFCDKYPKW